MASSRGATRLGLFELGLFELVGPPLRPVWATAWDGVVSHEFLFRFKRLSALGHGTPKPRQSCPAAAVVAAGIRHTYISLSL